MSILIVFTQSFTLFAFSIIGINNFYCLLFIQSGSALPSLFPFILLSHFFILSFLLASFLLGQFQQTSHETNSFQNGMICVGSWTTHTAYTYRTMGPKFKGPKLPPLSPVPEPPPSGKSKCLRSPGIESLCSLAGLSYRPARLGIDSCTLWKVYNYGLWRRQS